MITSIHILLPQPQILIIPLPLLPHSPRFLSHHPPLPLPPHPSPYPPLPPPTINAIKTTITHHNNPNNNTFPPIPPSLRACASLDVVVNSCIRIICCRLRRKQVLGPKDVASTNQQLQQQRVKLQQQQQQHWQERQGMKRMTLRD